jgi:hypothetical protein
MDKRTALQIDMVYEIAELLGINLLEVPLSTEQRVHEVIHKYTTKIFATPAGEAYGR